MILEPLQNETPECPAGFCAYAESEYGYHLYLYASMKHPSES